MSLEEFKILGGGLSRPGKLLQKNWDDNWHPVCDNFDNKKSRSLFGDLVCRQNGFAKAARTTQNSSENEEICPECWKDFAIVGISCKSKKGETTCDYTQSHYAGPGSCIKGKSDLYIQCENPQSSKGEWSSWTEWSDCYDDSSDYFKQRSRTCYDDGKRAFCSGIDFELKPGCLCVKAKENTHYNEDYYSDSYSDSLDYDYSNPLASFSDKTSSFESALEDDSSNYSYYYRRRRRAARSTFVRPSFCKKYDFHELYSSNSDSPSFILRNPDLSTEYLYENVPIAEDDVTVTLSESPTATDELAKGGFGSRTTMLIGIVAIACVVALLVMFGIKRKKSRENRGSTLDDEIKRPSESIGLIVPKPDESKNPSTP